MIGPWSPSLSFVSQQLAYHAPNLVACLIGLILAAASLRRCPGPALLVLLGTGLLLLTTIGGILIQGYLLDRQTRTGWGMDEAARVMLLIGIVRGLAHALGIGLLLAAAFVDRGRPPGRKRPPVDADWTGSAPR